MIIKYYVTATICSFLAATPKLQINDYLDDCSWCEEQAKYTQPLNIGEWYTKCKRVPKPLWFNHKLLGRTYSSSDYLKKDKWLYTKQYGWVYKLVAYDDHYYIHEHGWVYVTTERLYSYKNEEWYSIKLFNKHKLMRVE